MSTGFDRNVQICITEILVRERLKLSQNRRFSGNNWLLNQVLNSKRTKRAPSMRIHWNTLQCLYIISGIWDTHCSVICSQTLFWPDQPICSENYSRNSTNCCWHFNTDTEDNPSKGSQMTRQKCQHCGLHTVSISYEDSLQKPVSRFHELQSCSDPVQRARKGSQIPDIM